MRPVTVLRVERVKHGYKSAVEFAKASGVRPVFYKYYEMAKQYYNIRSDERLKIAKALNIPVESFCDEKGRPLMVKLSTAKA